MSREKEILTSCRVVAVVGASSNTGKASNSVASYMKQQGYRIIPVNPNETEVLGEVCYPDLKSIPEVVDVVNIFRRSEDVPPVVDEAIAIKAKAVWMQLGIVNEQAAERAREAGIEVVMDRCIQIEHMRLFD